MKQASLIAFISIALIALMQLYSIINSCVEYWEYMKPIDLVFRILYFVAYCGIGYFFLKLFKQQR